METDEITLTGLVERKPYATGSKSEHDAIFLITKDAQYLLRQRGANAFSNPELEKLISKNIKATGQIRGQVFFVREYEELKNQSRSGE